MTPSLCTIVPVLNEAAQLPARLAALQPLRARGVQVVVVDGGSDDRTTAVAAALADQVLQAPRGRASQMNAGANATRSDHVLFLHADTVLPADADQLIAAALAQACWGRFDVRIDSPLPLLRVVERAMNVRSRLTGIATGDQAIFATRAAFEAAGGFPPIALMEDIALSTRLLHLGRPACLRQQVLTSGRRWEKNGVLRTVALMWWLRLAYFLGADPRALARRYGYQPPVAADRP